MFFTSLLSGFIVGFTLLCVMTKYLFSILQTTSEGRMQPPTLASAFSGEGLNALFQQIGVLAIFGAAVFAANHLGGQILTMLTMAFVVLVLPASVMLLALERNIVSAVNPLQLTLLISTLGWPYVVLYAHLFMLFLAMGVAVDFLSMHTNATIAYTGAGFFNSYFMMMIFHMLGYVLFQYQEKLGYATADEAEEDQPAAPAIRSGRVDADIDLFLKEGDYKRVKHLLLDELKKKRSDPWRLEQLYRLCIEQGDIDTLKPFISLVLDTMLIRNQDEQAIKLLKRMYQDDNDYELKEADISFKMAQTAYHLGEYKLIIRLLKDYHSRYPDDAKLVDAYILLAKTLGNGLRMKEKAMAYLRYIIKQFPEHVAIESIKEMEETLGRGGRI